MAVLILNLAILIMTNQSTKIILIAITCLWGFFLVQQWSLQQKIRRTITAATEENLAIEVTELLANTEKLDKEITLLQADVNELNAAIGKNQDAYKTIVGDIKKYRVFAGSVPVNGRGVIIRMGRQLEAAQLIDLINSLRNIGAEAIAINQQRLIGSSGIQVANFSPSYEIIALGSPDSLQEALKRGGGILEQIDQPAEVTKSENLTIPAIIQ